MRYTLRARLAVFSTRDTRPGSSEHQKIMEQLKSDNHALSVHVRCEAVQLCGALTFFAQNDKLKAHADTLAASMKDLNDRCHLA